MLKVQTWFERPSLCKSAVVKAGKASQTPVPLIVVLGVSQYVENHLQCHQDGSRLKFRDPSVCFCAQANITDTLFLSRL